MNEPQPYDAVMGGTRYPHQEYLSLSDFDAERFVALCRAKRGKRGFRETAKEAGLRWPLISNAENLLVKDAMFPRKIHFENFLALCKWLDVHPAELVLTPTLQKILADCGDPQPRPTDAVLGSGHKILRPPIDSHLSDGQKLSVSDV